MDGARRAVTGLEDLGVDARGVSQYAVHLPELTRIEAAENASLWQPLAVGMAAHVWRPAHERRAESEGEEVQGGAGLAQDPARGRELVRALDAVDSRAGDTEAGAASGSGGEGKRGHGSASGWEGERTTGEREGLAATSHELSQGGEEVSQGGEEVSQGGEEVSQGGEEVSQGGEEVSQGGEEASQGGEEVSQGGEEVSQGGEGLDGGKEGSQKIKEGSQGGKEGSQGGKEGSQGGETVRISRPSEGSVKIYEVRGVRIGEVRGVRIGEVRGVRIGEVRGVRIGEVRGVRIGEVRGVRIGEVRGVRIGEVRGVRIGEVRGVRIGEVRGVRIGVGRRVRGSDAGNLGGTRAAQRDLWEHQFPPHRCRGRRLLLVHWPALPPALNRSWKRGDAQGLGGEGDGEGLGEWLAGAVEAMGEALAVAVSSGRVLVPVGASFSPAQHPACRAHSAWGSWHCYFHRLTSPACQAAAHAAVSLSHPVMEGGRLQGGRLGSTDVHAGGAEGSEGGGGGMGACRPVAEVGSAVASEARVVCATTHVRASAAVQCCDGDAGAEPSGKHPAEAAAALLGGAWQQVVVRGARRGAERCTEKQQK
ncbi:unnamed protein product, partial [Closterium sp. NIES-64]